MLAVAKSGDARHGFLLLTRSGEIGVFTPRDGLVTTPFPWRKLDPTRWHRLLAVGNRQSTAFFCDDRHIGSVSATPGRWRWPARREAVNISFHRDRESSNHSWPIATASNPKPKPENPKLPGLAATQMRENLREQGSCGRSRSVPGPREVPSRSNAEVLGKKA